MTFSSGKIQICLQLPETKNYKSKPQYLGLISQGEEDPESSLPVYQQVGFEPGKFGPWSSASTTWQQWAFIAL